LKGARRTHHDAHRDAVIIAFTDTGATPIDETIEDRWMAIAMRRGAA
jgi:hypothetical protein